jgi:hypothetical protein
MVLGWFWDDPEEELPLINNIHSELTDLIHSQNLPQFFEIIRTGSNHFQNLPQFFEIIRTGSNHFQNLPQFFEIIRTGSNHF